MLNEIYIAPYIIQNTLSYIVGTLLPHNGLVLRTCILMSV